VSELLYVPAVKDGKNPLFSTSLGEISTRTAHLQSLDGDQDTPTKEDLLAMVQKESRTTPDS
jgi:hypothetical protein